MRFIITIALLTLVLAVPAASQPKVGYLNPQAVLDKLPEKVAIERQLNNFLDQREAEFEEKAIEFQSSLAQYRQAAPNLSEAENRRMQQELQVKDQELEAFQRTMQQELERRQSELLGPVLQEMNSIIEAIAKEKNLDFVLNEATGSGELFLLYVSGQGKEHLDLTDEVLSRMLK